MRPIWAYLQICNNAHHRSLSTSKLLMRLLTLLLMVSVIAPAQNPKSRLRADDDVRIREFYRLATHIQDRIWHGSSRMPAPLLLITADTEFLYGWPGVPQGFTKVGEDLYTRPRVFPADLLATFPAFGPPSVIAIGEPQNTTAKTSTPWLITVMHEHFHQLQNAQPGYFQAVNALGLSGGDKTGMWMLNYPFPYSDPQVSRSFADLRDLLLTALTEQDETRFARIGKQYRQERKAFFSQLTPNDRKYLSFQLWQEGIARYTEIKAAESSIHYIPTPAFAALADYSPFAAYGASLRDKTLSELKQSDIAKQKRIVVYSFGAAEGLLLDRLNPKWKDAYFKHMLSMDEEFEKLPQ
jgi:hypothetical protein